MTWLVENPWPAVALGLTAEAILAVSLVRTRRGNIVGGMIAVATATIGLVVIERLIVTDSEKIEATLDGLTRALVANDIQGVVAMFTTDSPRVNEVRSILSHVTIRHAKIGDLEVRVDESSVPISATAHFTERVEARDNRGNKPYEKTTHKLKVTLHKEGGRWLLYDYSDASDSETARRIELPRSSDSALTPARCSDEEATTGKQSPETIRSPGPVHLAGLHSTRSGCRRQAKTFDR